MRFSMFLAGGLCSLAVVVPAVTVNAAGGPTVAVDAATRSRVVDRLLTELRDRYVFPTKVTVVEHALRAKLAAGAYDRLADSEAFARALTDDAFASLHDKHVRVRFRPEGIPVRSGSDQPTADEIRRQNEGEARVNYGFERIQRLRGDIGYLDLRGFSPASLAAPTLGSAMQVLAHTQGLIIDLRQNGGGDPETVSLLCSYLFSPDERVHVNDLAMRVGNREAVEQYWTSRVPGPYYLERPVYLLTSSRTFSGAEEFAYDLQNLKRATLVGETTGGGANPGDFVRLDEYYGAFIPSGRAISPVTHTNWEGIGVKPDVATAAADALKTAYLALLRKRTATLTDPEEKSTFADLIAEIEKTPPDRLLDL